VRPAQGKVRGHGTGGVPLPWLSASGGFTRHLVQKDREVLLTLGTLHRYRKGEMLFRAGARGKDVYLVESGRVKVSQIAPAGREIILWFCFPGELFGLAAVPGTGPRMVFAQAVSDVRVRQIPREEFLGLLLGNPRVSLELINLVLARLYLLCDALLNVTAESAEFRIRNLLRRLCLQYGQAAGKEVFLDVPLTQQDIADMIGASRQTVSGLLARMKERGVIRMEGRRMYVREDALETA
jgi:CRP/FNR family transcriptional regulator, cyclic AMP receptor protein